MANITKKSRTHELIESLKLPKDFLDPKLPKGSFSHSQYNQFKKCGRAYEFKYVLGVMGPSTSSMSRGSAVHKGIEAALKRKMETGRVLPLEDAKNEVNAEFDQRAQDVTDWDDLKPEGVKKEALALYEAYHINALPKINPVAIEKGFAVKFGGVPMVGWIDLIDEQPAMDVSKMDAKTAALVPKKRVVADTKTAKTKWSDADVRNDTQLTLYSAVEGTPHVRIDQLIPYKGKGATYVPSPSARTTGDVVVLEEDVSEVADFIRKGIFPKTEIGGWACTKKWCPYWTLCRGAKQ
jgi:hypothetical protein